jgi:hypothetical protein
MAPIMNECFDVDELDVERLLIEWRWLCPQKMALAARSAFGDLFLRDENGSIFWLDVSVGKLTKVADNETDFRALAETDENRQAWFGERDAQRAAANGLRPGKFQCVGFKIPIVFAQADSQGNAYVADLYDCVAALGSLNRQIADVPDGGKVRIVAGSEPPDSSS